MKQKKEEQVEVTTQAGLVGLPEADEPIEDPGTRITREASEGPSYAIMGVKLEDRISTLEQIACTADNNDCTLMLLGNYGGQEYTPAILGTISQPFLTVVYSREKLLTCMLEVARADRIEHQDNGGEFRTGYDQDDWDALEQEVLDNYEFNMVRGTEYASMSYMMHEAECRAHNVPNLWEHPPTILDDMEEL